MLIMGEAMHTSGLEVYKNSVHSSQFWCTLGTARKNRAYLRAEKKPNKVSIFKIFMGLVNVPESTESVHKYNIHKY